MSTNDLRKKRGRPATARDILVGVKLPLELDRAVDVWAKRYGHTRASAIRLFIEIALKRKG
jgi:predicted DNA-binding protein